MPDGYVLWNWQVTLMMTVPTIGFIAHVDTADFNGANVRPQVIENYDGQATIPLGESGYDLNPTDFQV